MQTAVSKSGSFPLRYSLFPESTELGILPFYDYILLLVLSAKLRALAGQCDFSAGSLNPADQGFHVKQKQTAE